MILSFVHKTFLIPFLEITNMRGSSSFVRSVSQVKRNVMTAFVSPVASSILFSVRYTRVLLGVGVIFSEFKGLYIVSGRCRGRESKAVFGEFMQRI